MQEKTQANEENIYTYAALQNVLEKHVPFLMPHMCCQTEMCFCFIYLQIVFLNGVQMLSNW